MNTAPTSAGPSFLRVLLGQLATALTGGWHAIRKEPGKALLLALAIALAAACAPAAWIPATATTPDGLLGLEFPGTRSGALGALALLDEAAAIPAAIGREAVKTALAFDYGFIAGYAVALYLIVGWLARRRVAAMSPGHWQLTDRFARWAPLVAGAFDVGENLGLWGLLQLHSPYPAAGLLASLTTLCATCKFTLLVFLALYSIHAALGRRRAEPATPSERGPRPRPAEEGATKSGFPRKFQEFDLGEPSTARGAEPETSETVS